MLAAFGFEKKVMYKAEEINVDIPRFFLKINEDGVHFLKNFRFATRFFC